MTLITMVHTRVKGDIFVFSGVHKRANSCGKPTALVTIQMCFMDGISTSTIPKSELFIDCVDHIKQPDFFDTNFWMLLTTLRKTNITNWNITMFIGKSIINGPFSIAMLVYQRVMFRYLGPPNYLPLKHGKCTKCTKLMKTYGVKPCQLLISGKHQQIFPWNGDLGHLEPRCQWRWPNPDAKGARNIGHLWWIYHTHTHYI